MGKFIALSVYTQKQTTKSKTKQCWRDLILSAAKLIALGGKKEGITPRRSRQEITKSRAVIHEVEEDNNINFNETKS